MGSCIPDPFLLQCAKLNCLSGCQTIYTVVTAECLLQVDIDTVEKFESLRETEKQYFLDMVKQCKDSGATLIICQWCCLLFTTPQICPRDVLESS